MKKRVRYFHSSVSKRKNRLDLQMVFSSSSVIGLETDESGMGFSLQPQLMVKSVKFLRRNVITCGFDITIQDGGVQLLERFVHLLGGHGVDADIIQGGPPVGRSDVADTCTCWTRYGEGRGHFWPERGVSGSTGRA